MGLAASQARFLQLTARKSNIEYQGQQINQQRMVLANKSADITNKMLALQPPTPPDSTSNSYFKVSQDFVNTGNGTKGGLAVNGQEEKITGWTLVDSATKAAPTLATSSFCYAVNYIYKEAGDDVTGVMYTSAVSGVIGSTLSAKIANAQIALIPYFKVDDKTGDIVQSMTVDNSSSFTGGTGTSSYDSSNLVYGTSFDDGKYNTAMNQYDFDKYTYDKSIDDINAETAQVQQEDKSLELKLKQLDSEHSAVSTELDAVKQVITKNVESTFKTFSS